MMIHYRMNVDGSLKLALLSRLAYFVGFSGTAFIFFFSDPIKPFEPDPVGPDPADPDPADPDPDF